MSGFTDERDAGPVYITHLALLLGMAAPMWLSLFLEFKGGGLLRFLVSASGLICLGLGDTAASVVGVLLGRWQVLKGSSKTAEGTLAGAAAMLCGVVGLSVAASSSCFASGNTFLGCHNVSGSSSIVSSKLNFVSTLLGPLTVVTFGAALLEAVTQQLDNLIVPVYYTAHLLILYSAYCTVS
jgi:dolichol kinase